MSIEEIDASLKQSAAKTAIHGNNQPSSHEHTVLPKSAARRALGVSLTLHLLLLSFLLFSALSPPPPMPIPHRLIVQSIALIPSKSVRASTKTSGPKKPTIPQEPPSAPPCQAPEPQAPKEEPLALQEEEPSPIVEKQSAPQETAAPSKPSAKPTKTQPAKKSTTAPTKGKGKPSPPQSKQPTSKTGQKKPSPSYDQKLLNEALQKLDKSASITKKQGSTSGNGSGSGSKGTSKVGSVGSLNVDDGFTAMSDDQSGETEGYSSSSPEACYIGDLIRRLQLNIRLPEPGNVRVKLTLKRNGAVVSAQVLGGKKPSVAHTIEEKLRSIHFSSFGKSFSGESEHTFSLRLSNELLWSLNPN